VDKELGMAEERIGAPESEARTYWAWTELFRTFQVALDPKKLLLAAAGIVVMFLGWWVLAVIFYNSRSEPRQADYDANRYIQRNQSLTPEEAQRLAQHDYQVDLDKYKLLYALAGPGDSAAPEEWKHRAGTLRAVPWNEDRGPNPYLLATGQLGRPWTQGQFWDWLITRQFRVLIEPLVKFLRPVILLLNPYAGGWNRVYLLFVTLWTLLTWAFFGGAITRLAAVQLAGKDRPGLVEAFRFVTARYVSYLAAPLVPLVFVALIVVLAVLYSLIHLIPVVGDLADSVAWPILLLLGFGQAILLVGLVGYPLMYATISAEGSDTFDALSRSYNYVYQSPWSYIWYSFVAVVYGAALVFFIGFMGSLVVYLTKWSLSQDPLTDTFVSRRVDNLFAYAPTSFQWRDLLVDVPALKADASPEARDAYLTSTFYWWNYVSAFMVSTWVALVFLLVVGFGYSYFFTAFTMVYLLMRRKVDDTELDEVYLEEDEAEEPLPPPAPPAAAPSGPGAPLQMVEAPALRTPPAPAAPATDGANQGAPPADVVPPPPAGTERPPEGAPPVG
jgi:hypothetical protein